MLFFNNDLPNTFNFHLQRINNNFCSLLVSKSVTRRTLNSDSTEYMKYLFRYYITTTPGIYDRAIVLTMLNIFNFNIRNRYFAACVEKLTPMRQLYLL